MPPLPRAATRRTLLPIRTLLEEGGADLRLAGRDFALGGFGGTIACGIKRAPRGAGSHWGPRPRLARAWHFPQTLKQWVSW